MSTIEASKQNDIVRRDYKVGEQHYYMGSLDAESGATNTATKKLFDDVMMRKIVIMATRNRKSIWLAVYGSVLCILIVLAYDPSYIDTILPGLTTIDTVQHPDSSITASQPSTPGYKRVFDLPFVPKDFLCDEMHIKVCNKNMLSCTHNDGCISSFSSKLIF